MVICAEVQHDSNKLSWSQLSSPIKDYLHRGFRVAWKKVHLLWNLSGYYFSKVLGEKDRNEVDLI